MALFSSVSLIHSRLKIKPSDPAVVLFTSGSEGTPKGVVLSHKNLLSNVKQLEARIDFNNQDILFSCLPLFHSFGLTGGMLLPLIGGIRTLFFPSPFSYRIIPELVYSCNATIMFGTDTFLRSYANVADPYDFYRMRYIFAGAEKVRQETIQIYMQKFGVRIFEGYGTTETAPVISVNSPKHNKIGSVGKLLPGINYKLEAINGITEGEKLLVSGPNVMLGYYKAANPGVIQPLEDQFYDTGDIVTIDENGYLTIHGRSKRFAKIAGEMVSLASVEELIQKIWQDSQHAVITVKDDHKGESSMSCYNKIKSRSFGP